MIREKLDPHSGAILFKKDSESKETDQRIEDLIKRVEAIEKRLKELEGTNKENS